MAQRTRKDDKKKKVEEVGVWDRFSRWLSRNQKVVMVVLLVLIAPLFAFTGPVFDYFSPGAGKQILAEVYGSPVSHAEVERSARMLRAAQVLDRPGYFQMTRLMQGSSGRDVGGLDLLAFFALKAKAERLGIGVSDAELSGRIRDAWRGIVAAEFAAEAVPVPTGAGSQQQAFQVYFQRQQRADERADELKKSGTFDSTDWLARIKDVGVRTRDVEETLRDVYTVSKLQTFVLNDVQVSDEDVYEEFLSKHEKRKLSWVSVAPNEALVDKFAQKGTEEELQRYYDENPEKFRQEEALRADYVVVPLAHFKTAVEATVTETDFEESYKKNRSDYRRTGIRSDEAAFLLLSAEAKAARDAEIYQPLSEVRDQVREKVIQNKAKAEMNKVVGTLRQRLTGDSLATAEALAEEFPFVKSGRTEFATQSDAEEVFGEAYVDRAVSGWFTQMSGNRRARIEPGVFGQPLPDDQGRVFYTKVETRRASTPRFRGIIDEVRNALGAERALRAVGQALEELAESQNAAGKFDLATLATSEIKVKAPGGEMVAVTPGEVQVSSRHVKQTNDRLQVWQKPDADADADADAGDAVAEGDEEEETNVENSKVILTAAFSIEAVGKAAAATTIEATPTRYSGGTGEETAFLVVLDATRPADPGEFDKLKSGVRQQLQREKEDEHLSAWRAELYREAFDRPIGVEEEVAAAGS